MSEKRELRICGHIFCGGVCPFLLADDGRHRAASSGFDRETLHLTMTCACGEVFRAHTWQKLGAALDVHVGKVS